MRVAHRAVLNQVVPRMGPIGERAEALNALWRARLPELAKAGWAPAADRSLAACSPLIRPDGRAVGRSTSCNKEGVCPHCWGRAAVSGWAALDRNLFGPGGGRARLEDADLLQRTERISVPLNRLVAGPGGAIVPASGPVGFLENWLRQGKLSPSRSWAAVTSRYDTWRGLTRRGVLGGLDTLSLGLAGPPPRGRFLHRMLLVVPHGMDPEEVYPVKRPHDDDLEISVAQTRRVEYPTRTRVADAAAWAWSYPGWMLDPTVSAKQVAAVLRWRSGRRLAASFGCCRSGSNSSKRPAVSRVESA